MLLVDTMAAALGCAGNTISSPGVRRVTIKIGSAGLQLLTAEVKISILLMTRVFVTASRLLRHPRNQGMQRSRRLCVFNGKAANYTSSVDVFCLAIMLSLNCICKCLHLGAILANVMELMVGVSACSISFTCTWAR